MSAPSAFELPSVVVDRIVALAIEEDLASGDITTEACVDPRAAAVAHAVAREPIVACGGPLFARTFARIDETLVVEACVQEGQWVDAGATLWTVRGRARSVLMGERVALNFVQRMAGVATRTRAFVDALPPGSRTRVVDTRKTTPGLRALERYSVRVGGGYNHRDDLGAGVLIKDNHLAAAGGVREAVARARRAAPHSARIACEVETFADLGEALDAGVDVVLLDNMSTADVARAVTQTAGRALVEVSGGLTLERVADLARAGADVLSVGALTHSVRAADIGLDFEVGHA